jgi:hypothetical protein
MPDFSAQPEALAYSGGIRLVLPTPGILRTDVAQL